MRTYLSHRLRAILRSHPDGLPVTALLDMTNTLSRRNLMKRLREMPDTYIDRWEKGVRCYQAIWCVIVPPENCPKPTPRKETNYD